MTEVLSYAALEPVFDWRLFAAVCGVRPGTPEAAAALDEFREEALSYIAAVRPEARCAVEFFDCATDGGSLFSSDGRLVLPMLRQSGGRSLCDYFPSIGSGRTAPLGLFAVCVPEVAASGPAGSFMAAGAASGLPAEGTCSKLPASGASWVPTGCAGPRRVTPCGQSSASSLCAGRPEAAPAADSNAPTGQSGQLEEWNPVISYAVRATMAEAASDFLRRRFAEASGLPTIMPAVGYPCCPDHSLKRDVLSRLDIGIELTESCAMVPETSVCGLVISAPDAEYFDVRKVDGRELERYCAARSFSAGDRRVFLYDFCSE